MAQPGDLSSKKVKNSYKAIVQHDGSTSKLYDGTGSMVNSIDVTRITASKANIGLLQNLSLLQIDGDLSVSGSTILGDNCSNDQVKIIGNTWVSGSLTVSGSCQGSVRSIGQAKFIYLQNPVIEDQKPAKVTRVGTGYIRGKYNVPRFGGENAALDVYGNAVITGSLIVTDTVFAQEFHSEHISSSIIYTSGSTKFGGDFSDTMTVTGSIFQSGSDAYFLNGIGIGTTGSLKFGTFADPGQDNPVEFTHLLRIDDPGHDGQSYKSGKLIYGTIGSTTAGDAVRFRDRANSEDIFVIASNNKSVLFTTNDVYNVGIAVPSGSTVDENLVVSSSTNARIKIESATAATSASLYLESGNGVWEIAAASSSTGTNNQLSESLVFRTNTSVNNLDTWAGNGTYTEALRLDNEGRAGFAIPSINAYQYPRQVQISGSLNIIQGRTIDINAGTFHDSDGINGIYFNNQKMIYVSGSAGNSNYFFGYDAGNTGTATTAYSNIGLGTQTGKALTTGDSNIMIGNTAGDAITTGLENISIGLRALGANQGGSYVIAIGTDALTTAVTAGQKNIAIGWEAMKDGVATGENNTAVGQKALKALSTGTYNVAFGHSALSGLTSGDRNIAIGRSAVGVGTLVGEDNVAIGYQALQDATKASGSVAIGRGAARELTVAMGNIAIGSGSMGKGIVVGESGTGHSHNVAIGTYALEALTSGIDNIAIGRMASDGLTTGDSNIAIGNQAMSHQATTGDNNIAIGKLALRGIKGGTSNIGIGYRALRDTTDTADKNVVIGYEAAFDGIVTGTDNIIVGSNAAQLATSLSDNIIIGLDAVNTGVATGTRNIIMGVSSSAKLTSGGDNIIVGSDAGNAVTTNTKNILLGSGSTADAGLDNAYAIGTQASVTQADSLVLGGQTGKRFRVGIGGITSPNATLEVSGTMNVTGSLTVSGAATFTNIGKAILAPNEGSHGGIDPSTLPELRALEVSGTSNFHGHTYVTGNLYVSDIVVAQEFHTEYVSASITFSSGSNKMGDTDDDVQAMTGSLRVTGSGHHYIMGKQSSTGIGPGAGNAGAAKVGINTMSPDYELDVAGDIGVDRYIRHNGNSTTNILFQSNKTTLSSGGEALLTLDGSDPDIVTIGDGGIVDFRVQTDNDSNTIYASGSTDKVGIGTNVPTQKLTVAGNISGSDALWIGGETNYISASLGNLYTTGNISSSGDIFATDITASGDISASGNLIAQHITASGNISASGTITAEHLYSTDDIVADGDISASGDVYGDNLRVDKYIYFKDYDDQGTTYTTQLIARDDNIQVWNGGLAVGQYVDTGAPKTGNGNLSVENDAIIEGHLTASGNISQSAGLYISSSNFVGTSGSFDNITVTGSGAKGTGSFSRINVNRIAIHDHELVTGQGLTVTGTETVLGVANSNTHNVTMYGNLTASNAWFSGSGGHISGSSITLTGPGNITASGHISSSGTGENYFGGDINIDTGKEIVFIDQNGTYPTTTTGGFRWLLNNDQYRHYAYQPSSDQIDVVFKITDNVGSTDRFVYWIDSNTGQNDDAYPLYMDGNKFVVNHLQKYHTGTGQSNNVDFYLMKSGSEAINSDNALIFGDVSAHNGSGSLTFGCNITASGTISASGGITAQTLTLAGTDGITVSGSSVFSGSIVSTNLRSFYIPAAGMTPAGTGGGPDVVTEERPGNASDGTDYPTYDMLGFDGSTNEFAHFQITMPYEWNQGNLSAKFYYMTNTATADTITWEIAGSSVGNNVNPNSAFGNLVSWTDTGLNDDEVMHITTMPAASALVIGGTHSADNLVQFRISRLAASDTYTSDAHLIGVAIQYQERTEAEVAW